MFKNNLPVLMEPNPISFFFRGGSKSAPSPMINNMEDAIFAPRSSRSPRGLDPLAKSPRLPIVTKLTCFTEAFPQLFTRYFSSHVMFPNQKAFQLLLTPNRLAIALPDGFFLVFPRDIFSESINDNAPRTYYRYPFDCGF